MTEEIAILKIKMMGPHDFEMSEDSFARLIFASVL